MHTAPEIALAASVDEPYTFVTEAEIREALPMLRARDGLPTSTRLGTVTIYRIDHVQDWLDRHPRLKEHFVAPRVSISEHEVVDADGVTHYFPLTSDQLTTMVHAAQDLHTRPADVVARLAHDLGISDRLMMSDGSLISDLYDDEYPWVSPYTGALDPEYLALSFEELSFFDR